MSRENLEQFMNKVAESEELQAKIGEKIDAEALIALGAECGCEFTAEELQDYARWDRDNDLATIGGPGGGLAIGVTYIPNNEYVAARLMDRYTKTKGVLKWWGRRKLLRKKFPSLEPFELKLIIKTTDAEYEFGERGDGRAIERPRL